MGDRRDLDERIRRRAYALWEAEGRPSGREEAHWDMATELVAIEDNQKLTTKPVDASAIRGSGEPVEPAEVVRNLGEFPTALTDQGEQVYPPARAAATSRPRAAAKSAPAKKSAAAEKPGSAPARAARGKPASASDPKSPPRTRK